MGGHAWSVTSEDAKCENGVEIENLSTTPHAESRELQLLLFNFLCRNPNHNRAASSGPLSLVRRKVRGPQTARPPGRPFKSLLDLTSEPLNLYITHQRTGIFNGRIVHTRRHHTSQRADLRKMHAATSPDYRGARRAAAACAAGSAQPAQARPAGALSLSGTDTSSANRTIPGSIPRVDQGGRESSDS